MKAVGFKWYLGTNGDAQVEVSDFLSAVHAAALDNSGWASTWLDDVTRLDGDVRRVCGSCQVPFEHHDEFIFRNQAFSTLMCLECVHQQYAPHVPIPEVLS